MERGVRSSITQEFAEAERGVRGRGTDKHFTLLKCELFFDNGWTVCDFTNLLYDNIVRFLHDPKKAAQGDIDYSR